MAANPKAEVIKPASTEYRSKISTKTKWIIFSSLFFGMIIAISILETFLPIIAIGLIIAFIWKQATTSN